MLTVSPYKERPYIWLKRMWLEEKEQPAHWLPCKGGFRFSVSDDGHEMHRFAKKCMLEEEGRKQYMRKSWKGGRCTTNVPRPPKTVLLLPRRDAMVRKRLPQTPRFLPRTSAIYKSTPSSKTPRSSSSEFFRN